MDLGHLSFSDIDSSSLAQPDGTIHAVPFSFFWTKEVAAGGGKVPVRYADRFVFTNNGKYELSNVRLSFTNYAKELEITVWWPIKFKPGEGAAITCGDEKLRFPPFPYEVSPQDVLVITCDGHGEKRIPMKELGKDRPLREIEMEENKALTPKP
jgi:hypothetical protein